MAWRGFLTAAVVSVAAQAQAANYAHCIIENMKGAESTAVVQAVHQTCMKQHPSGYAGIVKGSGLGVLSHRSGQACTISEARDVRNERAAQAIATACRCLYDKNVFDQMDPAPTYCAR